MEQQYFDPNEALVSRQVEAIYLNRRAFLERVQMGADVCRVYRAGGGLGPPGTQVDFRIGFAGDHTRFAVNGRVVQSMESASRNHLSGTVVEVTGDSLRELSKAYAYARGAPMELGRRAAPRYLVHRRARLWGAGGSWSGAVRDLTRNGAFVWVRGVPPLPDSDLTLTFRVGFMKWISIPAMTTWVGVSRGRKGVGVQFHDLEKDERVALAKLLSKLAARQPAAG